MRTALILLGLTLAGCSPMQSRTTFYLYRSAVGGPPSERIHVATFDTKNGAAYNEENCMIVRGLMDRQPGSVVGYWCTQEAP